MRKHTLTMTALLNNVILIAGLESGSLTVDIEPVALGDVLNDTLWSIRAQVAAKGLSLVVVVPDDLPCILADTHQLRSALHQLLDNARRYTDSGTIRIQVSRQGDQVRVDISDTGRGIDPDLLEHLFTRFSRGSDGINSTERGIGLGLAIARQLIEQQGGALWLEHTSDGGSTFSLMLPCVDANHSNNIIATAA
jgi:signal transduction histidine kinase